MVCNKKKVLIKRAFSKYCENYTEISLTALTLTVVARLGQLAVWAQSCTSLTTAGDLLCCTLCPAPALHNNDNTSVSQQATSSGQKWHCVRLLVSQCTITLSPVSITRT